MHDLLPQSIRKLLGILDNVFSEKMPYSAGTRLSPVKLEQSHGPIFKVYKNKQECGKSIKSFQYCITFHLLDMFPGNAAKQQCFYISNVLKKPQQVEQLNIYLSHLPCTYDSPRATAVTKPIKAYDKVELANLLLRICPKS